MHHKRKRPKNRRAGCLLCKPHKANHAPHLSRARWTVIRRLTAKEDRADAERSA